MQNNIWYNSVVAPNREKKDQPLALRVPTSLLKTLEEISETEDRPLGYVARELMVRGLALYAKDGKLRDGDLNSVRIVNENIEKDFDLTAAIGDIPDPHRIMDAWFASEGREYPQDLALIFFNGWESFSVDERHEALADAKKVLDRTLKTQQSPKGKIAGRIEPGIKQKQKAEAQRMIDTVELQPRKRKAK